MATTKISVILPTLNEVQNVEELYRRLRAVFEAGQLDYELIFIDDNSWDGTIDLIKALHEKDPKVKYLIMSRRYGDQICLMAGLEMASGDAVVLMDSDLQHPPEYIPQMVAKWREGYEILVMQRKEAAHKSAFKKWTEVTFYKLLGLISRTPIFYRFAGFVLLDRKVARALSKFKESDPFFRGLVAMVGFKREGLYYEEEERHQGKTKYHIRAMIRLALTGVTSFSELPLYLSFYLGGVSIVLALLYTVHILIAFYVTNEPMPSGWPSLILSVLFLGGVQLFSIGTLGIYVGKIYMQSKGRPNYVVSEAGGLEIE